MKSLMTLVLALAVTALVQSCTLHCPYGWAKHGDRCYRLFNFECPEICSYWTAWRKCETFGGGILANIKTQKIDRFLQRLIGSHQNDVMVGGFYENWYWEWSDMEHFRIANYTNWAPSEPAHEGNMLMGEAGWIGVKWSRTIENKDAFICEKEA